MAIKNYIWDFDGTLFDTYPAMVEGAEKALRHFDVVLSKKEIYRIMKQESTQTLRKQYGLSEEEFGPLFHQYEQESTLLSAPFEDTEKVLRILKERGAKHYILTHRNTASTWNLLEKFGIENLIDEVIGIDQDFPRKPAPDAINYLIATFELMKADTLMIGDRRLDILAGKNAGILTCLYDLDHFLGEIPADFIVTQLSEIPTI
ncbi:hypothetical protein A5844_000806 [Enterococcus sp. 10A9_DIV0425]|uniref:Phosphoglycolate phosphatase n=1 Tax=Candidatus Enterococcus wittei TaxID=1987383 RepID=A0A2C9XQW0_9ENTE|nr:hypothetical protein A5844_000806 [Enterococcus sp. 10A9_DIV0425]